MLLEMLRSAREKTGLNQTQLAKKLRIAQATVSKFEVGDRRLDIIQLRDWCRALNEPFSAFVAEFDRRVR